MRRTARTAATAAAAVLLATGCGAAHYPGVPGSGQVRTLAAATAGPPTITRPQAERLARTLLGRATPPPGARLRTGRPPAAVAQAVSVLGGSPSIELHRWWTVAEPMNAAYAFAERHVPGGMSWTASGQGAYRGTVTDESVSYGLKALPAGVSAAALTMTVAPAPGARGADASVVRADVQVTWFPPRSAAEYVPAGMHVVTVTASFLNPRPHSVTKTITSQAVVRRLAAMLNGVYAAPAGGFFGCPLELVTYRLAFAGSPRAAPYLTATETACPFLQVTAGGRAQPALETPAGLQNLLGSLTGATG